ncbi:MAG TPA: FkbM family methyltransferase [Dokdonella sp.]|mgnify:CR=1 FL=1|nr:FkbM family methyltransferase [Dokdonella sp.]
MPLRADSQDVRYAYRLLLGREPDDAGFSHHMDAVRRGNLSTQNVAQNLMRSEEYAICNSVDSELQEVELGGVKFFPWRGDRLIGRHLVEAIEYEPNVLPVFLESIRPGDFVLDVGANIGIFSLFAAQRVGASGQVLAIEPVMKNVNSLCAGILENAFKNVAVFPIAASDRVGVIALIRDSDSSNGIVDSHFQPTSRCDYVPTQRLDFLFAGTKRIDVIKIDIEGHEPVAWSGLKSLVAEHRPLVFTEFAPVTIRNHSHTDPEQYLDELFEFADSHIDVLHRDIERVRTTSGAEIMREWRAANERAGLDGTLHLDLMVDTRK